VLIACAGLIGNDFFIYIFQKIQSVKIINPMTVNAGRSNNSADAVLFGSAQEAYSC
jgi:hypothetical protein